ncbi:MAG TPA: GNAT family N-acetyltransferase [Anaerolineales bacterium]
MTLSFLKAAQIDLPVLANLFNNAFDGYIGGDVQFDPTSFARFLAHEGIDLSLSDIALQNTQPIGLALIAQMGWTSRLAAMGVAKEYQGQGVGKLLLAHSFEQACERGGQIFTLECIEQNQRGVRLYEGAGFRTIRRLLSFRRNPSSQVSSDQAEENAAMHDLEAIDIPTVARLVAYHVAPDLPWQVSGYTLARFGPPYVAANLGPAYAVISSPEQDLIALRNFFVLPQERSQGFGKRLIESLMRCYPNKIWVVPAICPEEYGGFFRRIGFEPDRLSQLQMVKKCA